MLEVQNLSISFGKKGVVKDFNLRAGKKERIVVIGGNGSGKTTIALFLAGVIPEFIHANVSGRFAANGKIGLVMQNPDSQFLSLTVRDELQGMRLNKFNLQHLLDRNVFELSEGEKQKINLVSNILHECDILLLDEPLELLDPVEARRFMQLIGGIRGKTIIWFDKSGEFVKNWKKIYLGKFRKVPGQKKKQRKKGGIVLGTNFSTYFNGFALKKIKMQLHQGEKIAIIGANGSGKSTVLKAIAGAVKVKGKINSTMPFSFAPQNPTNLFFEETVEAELLSNENAGKLGIQHLLKENPVRLSKGQQKMVGIASIAPGTIALLDEPTTWLDNENKSAVYSFINSSSQPMIIATHDRQLLQYCDKIFIMREGRLSKCSDTTANRFFQKRLSK
jgi:energy-coupling factor transport system ATP-binding protein